MAASNLSCDFLDTLEYYSACTPDWLDLTKSGQKEFVIFVYDGMKMGFKNHKMLKDATYYGRATTLVRNFNLRDAGGGQPVAFLIEKKKFNDGKSVNEMHMSSVHGELYGVSQRVIADIDFLLANGSMFHRIKKWFSPVDEPNKKKNAIEGFMYIGDQKYWGGSVKIMASMRRCPDVSLDNTSGFYWGVDPRTDEEVRDDMYAESEAYGYDMFWGRGGSYHQHAY